jgi:hypothetical protein
MVALLAVMSPSSSATRRARRTAPLRAVAPDLNQDPQCGPLSVVMAGVAQFRDVQGPDSGGN